MNSLILKAFIFFYYASYGVILPYLPLMFEQRGYEYWQIGLLLALGGVVYLTTQSWWGYICDKLQTIKKVLIIQLLLSVGLSFFIFKIQDFWVLFVVFALFFIFYRPVAANIDVLILNYIKEYHGSYSNYRLYGSLGFVISVLTSGFIMKEFGIGAGEYLIISLIMATLIFSMLMFEAKYIGVPPRLKDFIAVFKNQLLLTVLVLITLLGTTHLANDNFISIHIKNLGGTVDQAGLAWTVGVTTEIMMFALLPLISRIIGDLTLLKIVSVLYIVRWLLLGFITDVNLIIMVQVLHGICFAPYWAVSVKLIDKLVPENLKATGQGIRYMFVFGIGGILGSLGAGVILSVFGDVFMYMCCVFLSLLALFGFISLGKRI